MEYKTTLWIVKVNGHSIIRKYLSKYWAQDFIKRVLEDDKTCQCTLLSKDIWLTLPIG